VHARNPEVACPEERGRGKMGGNVGNLLPREGPGLWNPFAGYCRQNRRVEMHDDLLDERGIRTGELESVQTMAGVKLFQHVQEEIVEQLVVSRVGEEGLGGIIFCLDAVGLMALPEMEQAACRNHKFKWAVSGLDKRFRLQRRLCVSC
jgi:hypothetical protein